MKESRNLAGKITESLFWVYCENITAQLVSFIVSIILARLLEPEYYGTIALVTVFIGIANVFVTSSFSYALIQKENADELDYSTMFWFNLGLSLVLFLLLFLSAPAISTFYRRPELTFIIRVLAVRIPLSAYNSIQLSYVAGKMIFKKSFISNFGGAAVSALVGIGLAYAGAGIWALVVQNITNILFNTFFLVFVVKWRPKRIYSVKRLKPMLRFGWKLLVTGLMSTGYSELRTLVIGKRYSADELGYYDKGYTFPRFIASNIDATINRVLFPVLSQNHNEKDQLAGMTRRAAKMSAYLMTPVLFGLATVAVPLVRLLLTEKWMPCVPYLQVMCFVWWLQPTQSCSIQAIKAMGKSDLYLLIEAISKALGILLLIGAVTWFNTAFTIAVSMLAGQIAAAILYGVFVSKYVGYKFTDQICDLLIPAFLSGLMCVGVYLVSEIVYLDWLCLMIQVLVGILLYSILSWFFRIETFLYLLGMIRRKRNL